MANDFDAQASLDQRKVGEMQVQGTCALCIGHRVALCVENQKPQLLRVPIPSQVDAQVGDAAKSEHRAVRNSGLKDAGISKDEAFGPLGSVFPNSNHSFRGCGRRRLHGRGGATCQGKQEHDKAKHC